MMPRRFEYFANHIDKRRTSQVELRCFYWPASNRNERLEARGWRRSGVPKSPDFWFKIATKTRQVTINVQWAIVEPYPLMKP